MRVGIGYDIHRFNAARGVLKLGGVEIPHARCLAGHSDADVLLHALADALLGAIGAPDLGEWFPPTNPKYNAMDSRVFVEHAQRLIRRAGWQVGNVDATIVTDEPNLSQHKLTMRHHISRLLSVTPSDVSVKAKTTEGLPPGKHGIAAYVVVLLKQSRGSRLKAQGRSVRRPPSTVHGTR